MRFLTIAILGLLFFGCSHHKDVRPAVNGEHKVSVMADTKSEGARDAIDQAEYFCDKRNKSAAVVTEDSKYEGDMNESDYKSAKKASKAATMVGGATHVFGGKKESNIGGVVGLGGAVADEVIGKGYRVTMTFKCI